MRSIVRSAVPGEPLPRSTLAGTMAVFGAFSVKDLRVAEHPRIFLSHTTRDHRDRTLAHKLAEGLQQRGARVWIAPESIPAGKEWREQIVTGVMAQCTHFVVLLSAASVSAKWVLEEIRLAKARRDQDAQFVVLPLPLGTLPKHRYRDYLATLQAIAYHDDFHTQLDAVVSAVGLQPSVPQSVSAFIAEKTRDFVGRRYVYDAIDTFLRENPNGYFTIEGDPGAGKSALLAYFVKTRGAIAHFNIRAQGITTAAQFLENLCAQLIRRFGLPHASLPEAATRDGGFFAQLLNEAAALLAPEERLVIAIDALDEVEITTRGSNILYLPPALPEGVYFVMTRRQTRLPFTVGAPQQLLDLMKLRKQSEHDVREYIALKLDTRPVLRERVRTRYGGDAAFTDTMVQKSQLNFMYLRHVLPELEKGDYEDLELATLPVGLEGYYEDHWRRMGMSARPLPREKIRIVYVLSVARQPVSRATIAKFSSDARLAIDELAVQQVLDEWDEFLREQQTDGGTVYSIYHASFRDFLHRRDIVQAAGVTLAEINALVADELWQELFG